jgi:hypothetical protein
VASSNLADSGHWRYGLEKLRIDSEGVVAALTVRDMMAVVLVCFIGQVTTGKLILGRDLAVAAPT